VLSSWRYETTLSSSSISNGGSGTELLSLSLPVSRTGYFCFQNMMMMCVCEGEQMPGVVVRKKVQ
jgi:hypothetical protein